MGSGSSAGNESLLSCCVIFHKKLEMCLETQRQLLGEYSGGL